MISSSPMRTEPDVPLPLCFNSQSSIEKLPDLRGIELVLNVSQHPSQAMTDEEGAVNA